MKRFTIHRLFAAAFCSLTVPLLGADFTLEHVESLLSPYFGIQRGIAVQDLEMTQSAAEGLASAAENNPVTEAYPSLLTDAQAISVADSLEAVRAPFDSLGSTLREAVAAVEKDAPARDEN